MNRYARHIALEQVGEKGQKRIANSTALIIGLGGIGCAVSSYLACAGVGRLLICDFDTVDETNLGRQTLYSSSDIGQLKTICAASRLIEMNADIKIQKISERLDNEALHEAVTLSDVVIDGCDNFATRFQVNAASVRNNRPLISGAAIRLEGQLAVFGPDYTESPCYKCLYQEADESLESCAGNGVLSPVPGVIGTIMAVEALKYLAGINSEKGILNLYDAVSTEWQKININKAKNCPVCSKTAIGFL